MGQIVGLEISGIDAQALAAEHVVGAQQLGGGRILDDGADLVAREIGDGVVGGLLEQQVAKGAEERQSAALPGFFILPRAFFRRGFQRGLHVEREIETGRPCPGFGAQGRVVGLDRVCDTPGSASSFQAGTV